MHHLKSRGLSGVVFGMLLAVVSGPLLANQVNIYSSRHYDVDQLIYDAFTAETGIEVRLLEGNSDQLLERIRREGIASPADVLITVDAGRLWRAETMGLLQPVEPEFLNERVPEFLRHPDNLWFGFSQRIRLIYYSKVRFDPTLVNSYEDLVRPELAGQVCIRSSNNIYNLSLLASMIETSGMEETENWARGLVVNLARPPEGGDTDQIRGVAAGECDVAVANHYYYLRLLSSDSEADRAVAEAVGIIFPNQDDRGTHVNIGGAAVVANSPNRANAVRFLEFLASDKAQGLFAGGNYEYPVVQGVSPHESLQAWGELNFDQVSVEALGRNNPAAVRLADRVGWR